MLRTLGNSRRSHPTLPLTHDHKIRYGHCTAGCGCLTWAGPTEFDRSAGCSNMSVRSLGRYLRSSPGVSPGCPRRNSNCFPKRRLGLLKLEDGALRIVVVEADL